jgi:HAE1 family hydrophobic/amphiphilic exporter-1
LWTATGAGAISRRVLGSVVIGGMLTASFLAIFFIPVSFDVVERFRNWIGGKIHEPQPGASAAPATGEAHD